MKQPRSISIIEKTVIVNILFSKATGRKKMQASDLGLRDDQLPPDQVATLGSKTTINPKTLKVFSTLKRRADRLCDVAGVKLSATTYAIPETRLASFCVEMDKIIGEYETENFNFINKYDKEVEKWVAEISASNALWGNVIQNAINSAELMTGKFCADYNIYKLSTQVETVEEELRLKKQSLKISNGMKETVYKDITKLLKTFQDTPRIKAKSIHSAINKILEKVDGLTFFDPRYFEIKNLIQKAIHFLPVESDMSAVDIMNVTGLLHTMNSPELLESIISQSKAVPHDDFGFNQNNTTEIKSKENVQVKKSINSTQEFEIEANSFSIDDDCDFGDIDHLDSNEKEEEKVKPTNFYF